MDVSSAGGGRGADGCPLSSIVLPIRADQLLGDWRIGFACDFGER
jgi:hypothetical protein